MAASARPMVPDVRRATRAAKSQRGQGRCGNGAYRAVRRSRDRWQLYHYQDNDAADSWQKQTCNRMRGGRKIEMDVRGRQALLLIYRFACLTAVRTYATHD